MLAAGDIIRDRYRVERVLCRDAATDVYAVSDLATSRPLALKTVSRERLGSDILLARFERELELSRRISHPNVLSIEDAFEFAIEGVEAKVPCLLMERIEGDDLASRLGRVERLEAETARDIACQFADALSAAHRAGVVHRDLKPESVMLADQGSGRTRVVLIDFGVARGTREVHLTGTVEELTATNVILGTPYYMAPELLELDEAKPAEATPASDIYSLGLILFEMVTGRSAFLGKSTIQSIFMRLEVEPPSPRLYAPDLDTVWERVIRRCLERAPESRFADAGEIAAALRGEPPPASEPVAVEPPARGSSSWPWMLLFGTVLGLIASLIWLLT